MEISLFSKRFVISKVKNLQEDTPANQWQLEKTLQYRNMGHQPEKREKDGSQILYRRESRTESKR